MSETTIAALPASGIFPAPATSFSLDQYNAIAAIISTQNANNTSLRSGINACASL